MNWEFSKEETQMTHKYFSKFTTSIVITERQIRIILVFQFTAGTMVFKKTKDQPWKDISKADRILQRRRQKESKSQEMEDDCEMSASGTYSSIWSWTHSSCGCLHQSYTERDTLGEDMVSCSERPVLVRERCLFLYDKSCSAASLFHWEQQLPQHWLN